MLSALDSGDTNHSEIVASPHFTVDDFSLHQQVLASFHASNSKFTLYPRTTPFGPGSGIIAEPNRRAILSLLVSSQQSVGEIERQLRMPQPTVSKHLRVLRDAGFVESTVDAQRRLYRLKPGPLEELDAWLAQFRQFWSAHVDALERHLDRMDQLTKTKRPARTKRKK
jgi:DNA-binding transcriptional ArsR family regulator